MSSILGLTHYSTNELITMLLIFGIGGAVLGYISDVLMGNTGFGPFGNGFLTILGAFIGIHFRNLVLGPIASQESVMIGFCAAATATAFLLGFGAVKNRLRG